MITTRNHYRLLNVERIRPDGPVRFRLIITPASGYPAAHADMTLDPETFLALTEDLGLAPTSPPQGQSPGSLRSPTLGTLATEYASAAPPLYRDRHAG